MSWEDMSEVERLAHSLKYNTPYQNKYKEEVPSLGFGASATTYRETDPELFEQARALLELDNTPGTKDDRPDNWMDLISPDTETSDDSGSERTYTFYEGNETVESGADGISYLWNQEGYREATEDDLRAYFDQATNLQDTFGDFDTYLQYMNERQDLIDSGQYDPGSWGAVVDTGGLSYQDPYGNYIDPNDYNNLSPNDFMSKYGLDKSEVEVIQVDTTKGRQDAYNEWLNSEAVQALNSKYGISNLLQTDDGREYQWNGSGWVKTKERETLDFGGIAKLAAAAGFGALVGPALGGAIGSALGLGSTSISALGGAISSALQQVALGQEFSFEDVLKSAGLSAVASLAVEELTELLSDSQINEFFEELAGVEDVFQNPDGVIYTADELTALGIDPTELYLQIQSNANAVAGWDILQRSTTVDIPDWLNSLLTTVAETVAQSDAGKQAANEDSSTTVTGDTDGGDGGEGVEQCDDPLRLQDPNGGCGGCIEGYQPDEFGVCVSVGPDVDVCGEGKVWNEVAGICVDELFYEEGSPCNTSDGKAGTYDSEGVCIETPEPNGDGGDGEGGDGTGEGEGKQGEPCTTEDNKEGTLKVVSSLGFGAVSQKLECIPNDVDTSGEGGDGGGGDGTEEYTPVCTEPRPQDDLGLGPSGQTDASIWDAACAATHNPDGTVKGDTTDPTEECQKAGFESYSEEHGCYTAGQPCGSEPGYVHDETGECVSTAGPSGPDTETCPEGQEEVTINGETSCKPKCQQGQVRDEKGVCVAVTVTPPPEGGTDECENVDCNSPRPEDTLGLGPQSNTPAQIWDRCCGSTVVTTPPPETEPCPEGQVRDSDGVCVAVTTPPPPETEPCPEGQERDEEGVCVAVTSSGGGGGGGFGGGGSGMFSGAAPVQIGFDIAGDPQLLARSEFPITDYLAGLFKGIV